MKSFASSHKETIEFKRTGKVKSPYSPPNSFSLSIRQFFCRHHFNLNTIKRENEVSFLICTKCYKKFEAYYGYELVKYASTITPIGK